MTDYPAIIKQLEYYFSVENLLKDVFLRKEMSEECWVPVIVISRFNRMRHLVSIEKQDDERHNIIISAALQCRNLEVSEDRQSLRPTAKLKHWPLDWDSPEPWRRNVRHEARTDRP